MKKSDQTRRQEMVDIEAIDLRRADCCKCCKFYERKNSGPEDIFYTHTCSINGMRVTLDTICNRFEKKD